jgi:hypothetical protein
MKVDDLFYVSYGLSMELNKCKQTEESNGINFVSRTSQNNGVSARVELFEDKKPHPAGALTCAVGGSVLSTFVQTEPFYSGRDIYILIPKDEMSINEKLFYCMCIKSNDYKYAYGRQANKTLKEIELPDDIPSWVYETKFEPIKTHNIQNKQLINYSKWKEFELDKIFDEIYLAKPYHKINLNALNSKVTGSVPYITRTGKNNGINCYVVPNQEMKIEKSNAITVGAEGLVYFYQNEKFICGNKISILRTPELNKYNAFFLTTVLNLDLKKKYSYGRALVYSKVIKEKVFLPSTEDGNPDWYYMENYIRKLPFVDQI